MDKRALLEHHRTALLESLEGLRSGRNAARAGTRVDGTHRPASRGERAAVSGEGYLAEGLGRRIAELETHLRVLDEVDDGPRATVANGAQIDLEDENGGTHRLFVVPGGQGEAVDGVGLVAPTSPWVAPFLGARVGEVADVMVHGQRIEVELTHVV